MGIRDEGYALFSPGDRLLSFMVMDEESHVSETLYQPDDYEIGKLCGKYDLDVEKVYEIIDNKPKDVHTLLIEVQRFREHCKEVGDGAQR